VLTAKPGHNGHVVFGEELFMSQSSRNRRNAESTSVRVPMVESLEDRRLLSAVSLSRGGTLFVEGTRRGGDVVSHPNPGNPASPRRKAIVEPVFGQIMTCQDGRKLLLGGQDGARGEWRLLAACHNLRKIFGPLGTAAPVLAVA